MRTRPKLHLPVLGLAFRVSGVMAYFVIWEAVPCHIDLFESNYLQTVDTIDDRGGSPSCFVTLMASDLNWPSNIIPGMTRPDSGHSELWVLRSTLTFKAQATDTTL
jgi:hypothetical protein